MAIYECRDCREESFVPRRYRYHLGDEARCPHCGTTRLSRLKERDGIDPMDSGLLNMVERLAGGTLYHCCFCRVQFYDRRRLGMRMPAEAAAAGSPLGAGIKSRPDTAISDG